MSQMIPKGQPKVVTLDDGTKVIVVMVTQINPMTKQQVIQPVAFTKDQLSSIAADSMANNQATQATVTGLLTLLHAPAVQEPSNP